MIVFLSAQEHSRLLEDTGLLKKIFVRWKCDLGDFIKKEYANLISLHPEIIIIDSMAITDPEKISLFQTLFSKEVRIILLRTKDQCIELDDENLEQVVIDEQLRQNLWKLLQLEPEEETESEKTLMKIGFLNRTEDPEQVVLVVLNFISFFRRYEQSMAFTEVGKECQMKQLEKQMREIKKQGQFYEYQGIPLLYNTVKPNVKYSMFTFSETEKQMWDQCDMKILIRQSGEKIILERDQEYYAIDIIKNPFEKNNGEVYEKIFKEIFPVGQTEIEKETKRKRRIDSRELLRNYGRKAGILIFLLFLGLGVFYVAVWGVSNGKRPKKKEDLKEKIQHQSSVETAISETTQQSKVTQKKKKRTTTALKKETTESVTATENHKKTESERRMEEVLNSESSTRKKNKVSKKPKRKKETEKKKPATTAKQKNTEKKEPTTTEQQFDLDYQVQ